MSRNLLKFSVRPEGRQQDRQERLYAGDTLRGDGSLSREDTGGRKF